MKFGEIFRRERTNRGFSQSEVAKILQVSPSTIGMWEQNRRVPPLEKLEEIADVFNINLNQLTGNETNPQQKLKIPILGTIPAGIPISAVEDILGYEEIPQSMGRLDGLFALRVKGDSMEPNILEGDIIIVQQQPSADSGDIVVAVVNGDEATVKKIKITESGIVLIANNAAYTPMFYTNKEVEELPVRIAGKVIGLHREFA